MKELFDKLEEAVDKHLGHRAGAVWQKILSAKNMKLSAKDKKALAEVEKDLSAAVTAAEKFVDKAGGSPMWFTFTDGFGNVEYLSVSATRVFATDKRRNPNALSNYMFMAKVKGGYKAEGKALKDAVHGAYITSGGDAKKVLKALKGVTEIPAWKIIEKPSIFKKE